MDEHQKLIEALVRRAADDARAFAETNPNDVPTERWIENSFTAALPLAKDAAGVDAGPAADARLFAEYRRGIRERIGERPGTRDTDGELTQQPTPGEN